MAEQIVPDAHQELRERIAEALFNRSEATARSFVKWTDASVNGWRRDDYYDRADAVLSLLDEPTLLALLGMRQVGSRRGGLLHELEPECEMDDRCEPVYVKEAPRG